MKIKNSIVAMIIGILVFATIPANYAMASESKSDDAMCSAMSMSIDGINGEEFDADEPEIEAPATENEYLITDSAEEISTDTPIAYAVTPAIIFTRTTKKQVKSSVTLYGGAGTTKLVSKVYLLKKVGSDYKYTGKKSTKSSTVKTMIHKAYFSVEKDKKYKIKVVIIEYRGNKVSQKAPIYQLEK